MPDLVETLIREWAAEDVTLDTAGLAVVGRIIRLGQQMQLSAAKALDGFSLSYTDFDILATIRRSGAPYALTPSCLRQSVLLSPGAMTAAIDRLERAKLIKRRPSSNDRRSNLVCLTPAGRELTLRAAGVRFKEARLWIEHLSLAEQKALIRLLRKVGASADASQTASSSAPLA